MFAATRAVVTAQPFGLLFEHRPQYLYAAVWGSENSYEIAREYWRRIAAMLHRRQYKCVIVDKDFHQPLRTADAFRLVSELAHSHCRARIAVVERSYDAAHAKFEELVGTNRGMQIAILKDITSAERWLLGSSQNGHALTGDISANPQARADRHLCA